jgi:16S rRNA (guanine527-N7)-methyltransferase
VAPIGPDEGAPPSRRDPNRLLAALGDRHGLSADACRRLARFADLLAGDDTAPTTVRDPAAVMADHIADALVALDIARLRDAGAVADLGAGAGVPGLPLAITLPSAHVSLVEANNRKCDFIDRAIAVTETPNAVSVRKRAEAWSQGIGRCDAVLARAVAPLAVLAEYAAPLLRVGGILVAWRGKREPQLEAEAQIAAEILGLSVEIPIEVTPYDGIEHRYLHIMSKVSQTPDRFPRRPGTARRRPLGSRTRAV